MENGRRTINPDELGRINLAKPSALYALEHLTSHMRATGKSPQEIVNVENEIKHIKSTTPARSLS